MTRSSKATKRFQSVIWPAACCLLLASWSAGDIWYVYRQGAAYDYGDAEAHLNIARRIADSRTPGYAQIGRIWLPLPHLMLRPLARIDALWHSGLAGTIPSAFCFVAAGTFLFLAVRRLFDSTAAAAASVALFAGNPNIMYLQSTAMGEAVFAGCLMALFYFTVRFRATQGWPSVFCAGLAATLGALTRYEGWFAIPFAAVYFLLAARKWRVPMAALFAGVAALGPAYWLAHNWWLTGDPLDFYRGANSALAIQAGVTYPGHDNWREAWLYYRTAVYLGAGAGLAWAGMGGAVAALAKRAVWPVVLLGLPGIFYVWSLHSAATPIFVPTLWPNSFYNTRYGLAALPLLAVASGALVAWTPAAWRGWCAVLLVGAAMVPWVVRPGRANWVTWEEAAVNSAGRRQWIAEAAEFLRAHYVPGSGIITSFGDLTAVFRAAGIPLRETFTADNGIPWQATVKRPELFLWHEWALVIGGDDVQSAINRAGRFGIRYRLEKSIIAGREPVIEIYRRIGSHEDSLYQVSRSEERFPPHLDQ